MTKPRGHVVTRPVDPDDVESPRVASGRLMPPSRRVKGVRRKRHSYAAQTTARLHVARIERQIARQRRG